MDLKPYIAASDYIQQMHVTEAPKNFDQLADRASEILDQVTNDYYRYHSIDDDPFPLRVARFKRAVIQQVAYMDEEQMTTTEQLKSKPASVTQSIGATSVSKSFSNAGTNSNGVVSIISDDALASLSGTGLLYRGVMHL